MKLHQAQCTDMPLCNRHIQLSVAGPKDVIVPSCLHGNSLNTVKIVHQSDVVGASPVGAAPTTSSFST